MNFLKFFITNDTLFILFLTFSFFLLYIPLSIIFTIVFAILDIRKKKFRYLKKFLIIDGIVFVIYLLITGLVFYVFRPPAAEKLVQNFNENKENFRVLNEKILIDQKKGLERVDDTWTRPGNLESIGLNNKDVKDYRDDFKRLGVPRGFYSYPDKVMYVVYTSGLSISGSSRGYLYSIEEPKNYFKKNCGYSERPLKNIDDFGGCEGYAASYTIYQQIDKDWYIYEDFED